MRAADSGPAAQQGIGLLSKNRRISQHSQVRYEQTVAVGWPGVLRAMEKMPTFEVASSSALAAILRTNDVRVPRPGHGRGRDRKQRSERRIACRFLAAMSGTGRLEFPLRVETGERPDLVLTTPSGRVGIEITEAVPRDRVRVDARSEDEGIVGLHYMPPYRVSDSPRSQSEIGKIARGQIRPRPQMENLVVRNWVEAVLDRVECKAENCRKQDFRKYPDNWLLIYDNWSPAPQPDDDVAVECLGRRLVDLSGRSPFCRVFVQEERHVREFSRDAGILKHPIPDDWIHDGPKA